MDSQAETMLKARQLTMLVRQGCQETKDSKTSSYKTLWRLQQREKLSVSQESSLESVARTEQSSGIIPSDTSPTNSAKTKRRGLPSPGKYLRLHPL